MVGVALVGVVATTLSWGSAADTVRAAVLVAAVILAASLTSHAMIVALLDPARDRLGGLVIAGGMFRMLASLSAGLFVFFIAAPEGRMFWFSFLSASVLSLAVETWWGIAAVRDEHSGEKEPSES